MDLLGVSEVARRLDLGLSLTRELIARGQIESLRIGSRRLIPSEAVDEFIERLRAEQREPAGASAEDAPVAATVNSRAVPQGRPS